MARNKDRHFSESDSLNAGGMGASIPEVEERAPAWAQAIEKQAEEASVDEQPRQEAEDAAPAPAPAEDGGEQENGSADRIVRVSRRDDAEQAWDREAQRVEGGQYRRSHSSDAEEKTDKKKKKTGKKSKKANKSKKKSTKDEERRGFLRMMAIVVICSVLFLMVAAMILSSFVSSPLLTIPRRLVTTIVAPVQSAFSSVTDNVVNYLRTLKIRGNLEYEYEQLLIRLDDMANDTARMQELIHENEALRDILQEQQGNTQMNGLFAQVVGTVGNNYFSTLSLNVGSADGVADYMAVVDNGGLVGVTYNTKEHSCNVRCIIDSDCTVAGLVQSSRDQGSVKGTLGTNGEPMCRMYYLPDNSLPRPGDVVVTSGVGLEFPKGIPIGYIRESTRGMEDNKSYVVLEPVVDFQHLEYVTVYRYRPSYAENAQARSSSSQAIALEPLATARPVPGFELEGLSDFMYNASASPDAGSGETPAPTEKAQSGPTPAPSPTIDPNTTAVPENLEYHVSSRSGETPTPSPRPTFTPTPSPEPTPDAGAMTVEDDE